MFRKGLDRLVGRRCAASSTLLDEVILGRGSLRSWGGERSISSPFFFFFLSLFHSMLIDATLPLSFKSGGVALGIECTPSWPSPFPSCQLVHQDVLGTETLFLAWVDTTPDIEISRGHLEVIGLTDQIAYHLDLPQGSFPSSLKNRFLSFNQIPRSDAIWSGCVLKISIEFERPLASETKPYVEAFAG